MNWYDYIGQPDYQQADDKERERLRNNYWSQYVEPHVPMEQYLDTRSAFDRMTMPQGNPNSSMVGDVGDAFLHGAYQGSADLASGVDRLFGGDGQNRIADYLRGKANQQLDDMSPSAAAALQGFGFGEQADGSYGFDDGSSWAGAGLNFASGLGSLAPSMLPGGMLGRGISVGGRALAGVGARSANVANLAQARGVQALADGIDKWGNRLGYGLTGGAMIGGSASEGAKQATLASSYDDLKDNPRFMELYRQTYQQAGGGDTRLPFEQARAMLAEEAGNNSFLPGMAVGGLSMGIGGPALENVVMRSAGSRGANALKGFMVEGTQEFGEGYGQQVAENYGRIQTGQNVGLTDKALGQGITGTMIGGPVGGTVGAFGKVRSPQQAEYSQQQLQDLLSQNETLQDQMREPSADQDMLGEQLRENSQAIAALESELRHYGELSQAQPQAPVQAPEQAPVQQPATGPQPTSWADFNDPGEPPPAGVSGIPGSGPQDYSQYDRPAMERRQARQAQRQPLQLPTDNAIYVGPNSPAQRGETTFGGPGFEQQTNAPYRPALEPPKPRLDPPFQQPPRLTTDGTIYMGSDTPAPTTQPGGIGFEQQTNPPYRPLPDTPRPRLDPPYQQPPTRQLGYTPTDFTVNQYGDASADPQAPRQASRQRRQDQSDRAPAQHPGSTEYTGDPDQDLASYTERMNSLNRLFRSFNWRRGDESKKRRVRGLIETQRKLEMQARKSGRGITPRNMKEALANLKAMVDRGDGIRFDQEVRAIEAAQRQEGLRLTPQQKSGTPSGKKPALGKGKQPVIANDQEINTQYALYEQSDLIASHSDTGRVNPDYPAAMQPRDRARQSSETQIGNIASTLNPKKLGANPLASHGAPIIGSDRVVESGNGRVAAIRKAYRSYQDRAESYRQYLKDNAESFGLKPEDVDAFDQPVLVRQREGTLDDQQRRDFAERANDPDTATMSPAEKASLDAGRITQEDLQYFDTDGTGDLLHPANNTFLTRFADRLGSDAGQLKTRDGQWNKQMRDRVEAALFMKAYGDDRLNSLFAEEDKPDLKNLINALALAAPEFAKAKGVDPDLGGYGVVEALVDASRIMQDSRNRGQSVDELLRQQSMLEQVSPEAEMFARWFDEHIHKHRQMGQALGELARQIESYLQKQAQADGDMFGAEAATLNQLIDQTNNTLERTYGEKYTPLQKTGQAQAEPDGPAKTVGRNSEQQEQTGRPADPAREARRDEVDDPQDGGSANKRRERDYYQAREPDTDTGVEERKRRAKRADLEDAGQQNLFASPDVSGEARKEQIIENQRVLVKHVETGTIRAGTDTLNGPQDVGHFIAPIRKLAQEEMYAIVLDGDNKVLNVIKHSKGQKDSASVSPWTLAGAVVATPEAKSVWFAHNHPTGSSEASIADQEITAKLNDVLDGTGVVNNGHVVVGKGAELGVMDADGNRLGTTQATPMPRNQTFPVTERQLRMNRTEHPLNDPDSARRIADSVASPNAVILLNTKNQVTGVLPLTESDLKTLRHPTDNPQGRGKSHQAPGARLGNPAAARIVAALDSTNSNQVLLKSTGSPLAMKGMRNLVRFFNRGDNINVLDHLRGKNGEYKSSRELRSDDLDESGAFYALRPEASARGVQSGPLRLKMRSLEQRLNQPIHVLQAESELPSNLYRRIVADGVQGRVRGLFDPDTGATYLIAANLDNVNDATRTVLHELVGHKGIRSLLGNRLDTVLDEIHRDMSDRLKQALGKRYARQTEGMSEAEANRLVAEEYLAHLAEKDPQNSLLGKIVSMIRNALRRVFPNIKWTDADAVELLAAARQRLKRDGSFNRDGGTRYSDAGRAPTFYSAVERSAAAVKADKMPAQSWLNAIKKGDNVQDEEIQWLGLDLWLDSMKGQRLTRAEVLDYIRQNEVRIDESLSVDEFSEEELEDRLYDKQRDFIRERIGDYEHGYSLDELGEALEEAREDLRESEYDFHYDELKQRYEDEVLDDHEAQALLDDDGDMNESALHEEAQWRANDSVDKMDEKELARDHVSYSAKEEAALEAWENDYESDHRSDLEAELRDESGVQYRNYAMKGGEDYSELILTLDKNRQIFPAHPDHKNKNPITKEEASYLAQGMLPIDMKVDDVGWSKEFSDFTLYRFDADGNKTIITTGHASEASAIAAAVSEHQSFARWEQDAYDESHWGETENVLAHVRFQTFDQNIDGHNERILFIDEVQSDWHQAGRESGYKTPDSVRKQEQRNAQIKDIDDKIETVVKKRDEFSKQHAKAGARRDDLASQIKQAEQNPDQVLDQRKTESTSVLAEVENYFQLWVDAEAQLKELRDKRQNLFDTDKHRFHRQVPNAPLKENWPNLVMKRMLRHGAEEGFDRIAWSNAAQQVERYPSLGQVVNELKVTPKFDASGTVTKFELRVRDRNGHRHNHRVDETELEAHVGHRLGARIREETESIRQQLQKRNDNHEVTFNNDTGFYEVINPNGERLHDMTGDLLYFLDQEAAQYVIDHETFSKHQESFILDNLDEVVGDQAKGMREFYDKRLANYMKKYTRKWGAKLEPVNINFSGSQYPYDTRPDTVWSVTVTDKMKDSVLKDGQPLFALKKNERKDREESKPGNTPRYALKDVPDDVADVIKHIHGATQPKSPKERFKAWWDWRRIQRQINQGLFNPYAAVEHNEKQLNDGKLLDASLSASKAAFLTRNLDNTMEVMLHKGTPMLKDGSVIIKPDSKGLLDLLKPVAERNELEVWETWLGSIRARRIMDEDKRARAKGEQLLAQGQAIKEALDATAPDDWQGGCTSWNRTMKQVNEDLKLGKELSQQNRENLYDDNKIKTIQNWVATQPQLKQRFETVKADYQAHNNDLLDFLTDAGLVDKELRKLWDTDDYLPFNRVHDLEEKEQSGPRSKRGLSGQKSGIKKLTGGVEKISPLEAMYRNTRSMLDAAFKNIAMQRIVKDGVAVGTLEKVDTAIRITDDDVINKLREMEQDTNLTPAKMRRWKALLSKYSVLGEGSVSVSVDGKQQTYLVKDDPLLLASIQDLGQPTFSTLMKLWGIPRKVLTKAVTSVPDFMLRNLLKDTISTAIHIAPEVNGKPLSLNPLAGAVRGFRKSLKNDETRWAMMMGGGSGSGYYNVDASNIRKKLSPDEQQKVLSRIRQLIDLWHQFGSRFENSNRLHVYEQVIKQGGSPAEAAYQSMDVLNFTRSGQWPIVQFLVQSLPFFNSMLQGINRLWRGVKPGDHWDRQSFSWSVISRGLMYGLAAWALMRHYEDDERYKELSDHDKIMYHHFWIGEGNDGHYRIPKPFEVGAIFATLPEIITQSLDGNEDMKWTKDMLYTLIMSTFSLESTPIPQAIKPIWEIAENRDRFRDQPIIPTRLQNLKPEAQYDPYTSETLKELVQYLPEEAPDWMRSPKKLEHLLKGYFGTLGGYVLMATDALTREATGAAPLPSRNKRDYPVLGAFARDGVNSSNRYTSALYEMNKDVEEIAASIKRYRESGETGRARELEQSSASKLRNKAGLQKTSREISKLRKEVRRVMEDRLMNPDIKRQRMNMLNQRINQLSADAVKRYR